MFELLEAIVNEILNTENVGDEIKHPVSNDEVDSIGLFDDNKDYELDETNES